MIIIVTVAQDLHALAVQERIRASSSLDCHIIECDTVAQRASLTYSIGYFSPDSVLTSENQPIRVSNATVLWLRTVRSKQILRRPVENEIAAAIISNDSRGALLGLLATHFNGKWISTPEATSRASDKIVQLAAAHTSGFRIPRTLVSQSQKDVLEFYEACGGEVIVKTVIGAAGPLLETKRLDPSGFDEESFAAAPAIYQEYIKGTDHLRLNCFGNQSYAARIRTSDLDWRVNLNVPIESYPVSLDLHKRVRGVLDLLGLEMGIVDLKLTPEDQPVWLEVNPQGQFLFLDALTGLNLAEKFAAYLLATHNTLDEIMAQHRR
jgi:glutathione synthase/RimK-type ligase-like ATP-grasp enzyme